MTRPEVRLENFAADVPEDLLDADSLLTQYGRWAVARGGGRPATLDRMYIREADRKESLEAYMRRRETIPNPIMPTQSALAVQRALARVPERERIVLGVLYVPRKASVAEQLQIRRIPASLARIRFLAGLRIFDTILTRDWKDRP